MKNGNPTRSCNYISTNILIIEQIRHIIATLALLLCMISLNGCKSDEPAPIVIDKGGLAVKLKLSAGSPGDKPLDYETSGLDINNFVIICWEKRAPETFYSMDYDQMMIAPMRLPVGEFTMEVMYNTFDTTEDDEIKIVSYGTKDFTILKDQITEVTFNVIAPKKAT